MELLDIILGGILIYGLIKGLINGLFVEIASLVSFVLGIFIAIKFSYVIGDLFAGESSQSIKIISFVITFILVVIGIHLLAKVFSKMASIMFLGWLNRALGSLFGVFRVILYLGVCLSILNKISTEIFSESTKEKSYLYSPILKTSEFVMPILEKSFEEVKKKI